MRDIMTTRLDDQLSIQRATLGVLTYRQELLASNIANADTPHFKARDIDFRDALAGAVAGRKDASLGLSVTARGHLGGGMESKLAASARYRTEFQPSIDGNTVNMDIERAAFAENALRLEAALSFINGSFKSQQLALSQ
jgi:flagellar basal-body rod protein FlgB